MVTSCKKEKVEQKPQELKTKPLSFAQIEVIGKQVETYKREHQVLFKGGGSTIMENDEVVDMLEPLIENGRELHDEMVAQLELTPARQELTPEEQIEITDYNDAELAQLSFVMSVSASQSSVDWPRVRSCASAALGIAGISELWTNTLALGTVETAIGALKLIGRRYLGYIGIALMIYDFADCFYD